MLAIEPPEKKEERETEEEVRGCIEGGHDSAWSIRRGCSEQKSINLETNPA